MKKSENFDELLKALGKPSLSFPQSPPQPEPHLCARLTIHHAHIGNGLFLFFGNGIPDFRQHHIVQRSSLGTGGRERRDAAAGKTLGFKGDKKQWMLNSTLNRRCIVTWGGKRGVHNIIHVKHLSRACINARGGLWSPVFSLASVLFSLFFSLFLILTDGCDGLGSDQFNWVIQLCCSV